MPTGLPDFYQTTAISYADEDYPSAGSHRQQIQMATGTFSWSVVTGYAVVISETHNIEKDGEVLYEARVDLIEGATNYAALFIDGSLKATMPTNDRRIHTIASITAGSHTFELRVRGTGVLSEGTWNVKNHGIFTYLTANRVRGIDETIEQHVVARNTNVKFLDVAFRNLGGDSSSPFTAGMLKVYMMDDRLLQQHTSDRFVDEPGYTIKSDAYIQGRVVVTWMSDWSIWLDFKGEHVMSVVIS